MVGQVVVVFDGGEGCGFAEETEVVDWDGGGEESFYCWGGLGRGSCVAHMGEKGMYLRACPDRIVG